MSCAPWEGSEQGDINYSSQSLKAGLHIPRWKSHYSSFLCPTSPPNPRGNSFLGFFALIKVCVTAIYLNKVAAIQQSSAPLPQPVLGLPTSPLHIIDCESAKKMGGKGMDLLTNGAICHPGHFSWRMCVHQARPAAPPALPVGVCAPQPMQQLQMAWLFNILSASAIPPNPQSSFVSAFLNLLEWKVYPE